MRHMLMRAAILLIMLLAVASPVLAGGWATVRLDEAPGPVIAGEPWRFGFMVKQHDITPTNDVEPVIRAVHTESGVVISAEGTQVGDVGHFEAEITFPLAGTWKWEIAPEPYGSTSLETLTVGTASAEEVRPVGAASGLASLLRITLTLDIAINPVESAVVSPPAETVEIAILDSSFAPSRIEIAAGTEVIWANASNVAHGVMSDDLAFRDSGLLDFSKKFSQVFTTPGTYEYWCGPHPSMTGTIVVTE